jgi:hypothetical protein
MEIFRSSLKLESSSENYKASARKVHSVFLFRHALIYVALQARQANDLLRDKLTDFSSQLAEARDRIRELEHKNGAEAAARDRTSSDLASASELRHFLCGINLLIACRQTDRATKREN